MSFRLHLNEQFLYGEKNVNFNTADTDLFIPLDEEREDRRVFRKEDKPADGNTDNGNNDNGAQQ